MSTDARLSAASAHAQPKLRIGPVCELYDRFFYELRKKMSEWTPGECRGRQARVSDSDWRRVCHRVPTERGPHAAWDAGGESVPSRGCRLYVLGEVGGRQALAHSMCTRQGTSARRTTCGTTCTRPPHALAGPLCLVLCVRAALAAGCSKPLLLKCSRGQE